VGVRDEDGIDAAARPCGDGRRPPQVRNAVAQQRIRQQADTVEIDEDRRVTNVFDASHGDELCARPEARSGKLPVAPSLTRSP
jgi:hypothetical protein